MKRIHGTYSIQPGTITNDAIADDAAISESKIAFSSSAGGINAGIAAVSNGLATHTSSSTNPHGATLSQANLTDVETITAVAEGLIVSGTVKIDVSTTSSPAAILVLSSDERTISKMSMNDVRNSLGSDSANLSQQQIENIIVEVTA